MRRHLSYANVVSTLCLLVLLSGAAYAATTITGKDIKNSSVTGKDVKNSSLKGKDVKDGSLAGADLAPDSVSGAKVADGSLGLADLASDVLPGARAVSNTTESIPFGGKVMNLIEESYDTGNMYTPGADEIVVPRDGVYLLSGVVAWNTATDRTVRLTVDSLDVAQTSSTSTQALMTQEVLTVLSLDAGDVVRLHAQTFSESGAATSDRPGSLASAELVVQMVSP